MGEKEMPVDVMINQTEQRILSAINDSHLHVSIINLILRNIQGAVSEAMLKSEIASLTAKKEIVTDKKSPDETPAEEVKTDG